jgi:hypothetical protein
MKCEEAELRMIDYIDNTLEEGVRKEVARHLESCDRCHDMLDDYIRLVETVNSLPEERPDESLRDNFYHMLHGEINKQILEEAQKRNTGASIHINPRFLRMVAAFGLLLAGIFTGYVMHAPLSHKQDNQEITEMKNEIQSMKKIVVLGMLKEESPSDRIQAVNFAEDLQSPDAKVLRALTTTLNTDKNVNVRLAAAYSLARYAERKSVRDSLVASLPRQTEPILQVVLMNILVENKEIRAIGPMRQIISSNKTLKEVKDVAEKGLKVLL